MGITAKGAWVSVQRHFAERGVDVQTQPIRVVGCGDMSGDVFGNGMLLSQTLKIVAAFDHRHIFLDPDPDPAASWAERDRMFALPRSSWADYNPALISKGGGVFPRTAKTIALTKEVKAALDITADELEPAALISAILKAPGRPDLVRRHRHLCEGGERRTMSRSATRPTTACASMPRICARPRSARARTWA